MPDLIGINYDSAIAQLVPYNAQITKITKISPQPPGTVIAQEPAAGNPFQTGIILTVSTSAPIVPDVVNSTFQDADQRLKGLGFQVVEVPILDGQRVDGLVLKQDPPAGTANAGRVTLQVVRHPVVTYLSDMNYVSSSVYSWQPGTGKSNGVSYAHGILVTLGGGNNLLTDFDLSRNYRVLNGTLGLSDNAPTDAAVMVEIVADGRILKHVTLTFGKPISINEDVAGVLRLGITMTATAKEADVVLGDFQLLGLPSEVNPAPSAGSSTDPNN
ncbi:PASTA domain-containing protein [Arthrobacter dokdonensis]|uniref:PASTA domain-containing protein n=1 Tax=Arthrobacter dokdonellae TaxID=2211210 RepID=UPI001493EEDF|nr:PASTA domain-containing protein [Arthrobacter dokdonellae]